MIKSLLTCSLSLTNITTSQLLNIEFTGDQLITAAFLEVGKMSNASRRQVQMLYSKLG